MVREILKWTDKKINEIDENTKHPLLKSFGLGMIEGAIDGAVMMYPVLLISCYAIGHKLNKLEK